MNPPFFSIIIPVYNRSWSVGRAVESAISFSKDNIGFEIIIVDDASTDNSVEVIEELIYKNLGIAGTSIKLIRHATNKGVCGAKNTGGKAASGEWLIFLDSDDELIQNTAESVRKALIENKKYPLHFFKCVDENKLLISDLNNNFELRDFSTYIRKGTNGESLPVIAREVFEKYPYDEDVRGYESLSYLRIVSNYAAVTINSLVVRRYYTSHDDRLSSRNGMKKRYQDLARGHLRVLSEHHLAMSYINCGVFILRYIKAKVSDLVR